MSVTLCEIFRKRMACRQQHFAECTATTRIKTIHHSLLHNFTGKSANKP
jgi:hypothetical protein